MRQLKAPVSVALVASAVVVVAQAAACDPECTSLNDCPGDQVCDVDGTCIDNDQVIPPPSEGEGEGDVGKGEGEGEGEVDEIVDTDAPISMFVPDPDNAGKALLFEADTAPNGLHQLRSFDLATGALTDVLDYTSQNPTCTLDTILELDASITLDQDERWFSCDEDRVDIEYNNDFNQLHTPGNLAGAELTRVIAAGDNEGLTTKFRVITANRGGSQLYVVKIDDPAVQPFSDRPLEQIQGVTFSAIAGVYVVATADDPVNGDQTGDVILIFDRSNPPRLVPLQRDFGQETWHGAPFTTLDAQLDVVSLPADTHFAFFREANGVDNARGVFDVTQLDIIPQDVERTPNVVLTRPTRDQGTITFLRLEDEMRGLPSPIDFPNLSLQGATPPVATNPSASDRVLFEERVLNGETVYFYGLTNAPYVWRFPLQSDQDRREDVLRAQLTNLTADRAIGVIPIGDALEQAWIALSSEQRIYLIDFTNDL